MNPNEVHIPEWIKQQCIDHHAQFTLRVFGIKGDKPIKTNAEFAYQVNFLTPIKDTPQEAVTELKSQMSGAAKRNAEAWTELDGVEEQK